MKKYHLTEKRAAAVLAFEQVPSHPEGLISLLQAAGLENLNGNGEKRGLPLKNCPPEQLYVAAQRIYKLAQNYLAQNEHPFQPSADCLLRRCSKEWRIKLYWWLNLSREQGENYSISELEQMLCGE